VDVPGATVALDCGLFQGRRGESREKNEAFPDPPASLDAVVLSHAHIDHSGRLPWLVRRGFSGPIVATDATVSLCGVMLPDSAHIQEKDADYLARRQRPHAEPLYDIDDVRETLALMRRTPLGESQPVIPGVRATFHEAGHILGSASVALDIDGPAGARRLVFSGDIGRWEMDILRDPDPPGGADAVILESTYGVRDHPSLGESRAQLAAIIRETAQRGGKVLVPAFALGRTQELLYDLHGLYHDGAIPALPIFVDSPLAREATQVFARHQELFDRSEPLMREHRNPLQFELARFTESVDESKALNGAAMPMVIVAASGMCESGRILHHLLHGASDARNTILIVGFQAEHTLGRRIVERRPELRILGEEVPLRARVEVLNGYSAHGDRRDLRRWLDAVRAKSPRLAHVYLVHGEPEAMDPFADSLRQAGYRVTCPRRGDRVALD
jgi:metallo-beta-lactamase family protein